MRFFFALSLLICASCAFAQKIGPYVEIKIEVKQSNYTDTTLASVPLTDFKVVVTKGGKRDQIIRPAEGADSLTFRLELGHDYIVEVRSRGLCRKRIGINTTGLEDPYGFHLSLSFGLHPDLNRAQRRLLRTELLGVASYDYGRNAIEFDFDYIKAMKAKLKSLGDR